MAIVDPTSIGQKEILDDILAWLRSRPDQEKWLDYFAGSYGTTLIELMAGLGAFYSYQSISARRESNLLTAKLESSIRGIAYTLGYKINRKKGARIRLTGTAFSDNPRQRDIVRTSQIGLVKEKPLYLVQDTILPRLGDISLGVFGYCVWEEVHICRIIPI